MPQGILIDIAGDGEPRVKPEPKGSFGSNCEMTVGANRAHSDTILPSEPPSVPHGVTFH